MSKNKFIGKMTAALMAALLVLSIPITANAAEPTSDIPQQESLIAESSLTEEVQEISSEDSENTEEESSSATQPSENSSVEISPTIRGIANTAGKTTVSEPESLAEATAAAPLNISGTYLSKYKAEAASRVTAYVKTEGGTGAYRYNFLYRSQYDSEWTQFKMHTDSPQKTFIMPDEAGYFIIRAEAYDANGDYTYKDMTVTVTKTNQAALSDNGSRLGSDSVWAGQTIIAYASFKGGTEPYRYKYSYKTENGSWVSTGAYSQDESKKIKMPSSAGKYIVRINVSDAKGTVKYKDLSITVKKKTGKDFAENGSYVSKSELYVKQTLTAYAKFTGGVQPYTYKYSYRLGNGEWVTAKDYSSSSSAVMKMPSQNGFYTIRIAAKDHNGTYTSKYINVKVKWDSKKTFANKSSSLSTAATWANWTITANAHFTGGVQPYTYQYSYRLNNEPWVNVGSYTQNSSQKITVPNKAGYYTVRVAAKDANGTYTSKYISLKVKKDTKKTFKDSGSYLSAQEVYTGGGTTAFAKFTGGVEPYTYTYSYKIGGGNWTTTAKYTQNYSQWIKMPSKAGTYSVRVAAYDSAGNYQSKYLTVKVKSHYTSPMKGIDISTWQETDDDFVKAKAAGIDFVIIRAGYGNLVSQKDDCFEHNYYAAKAAGMKVGVYWYSYADSAADAVREANACISAIKGKTFDLPIFFDLEESSQFARGRDFCDSLVTSFCNTMISRGYNAGLYISYSPLMDYISPSVRNSYPLWIAQYYDYCQYTGNYAIWQYSDQGRVNGFNDYLDMDILYDTSIIKQHGS